MYTIYRSKESLKFVLKRIAMISILTMETIISNNKREVGKNHGYMNHNQHYLRWSISHLHPLVT